MNIRPKNLFALHLFTLILFGCSTNENQDPVPVLTFRHSSLICYMGSGDSCFNPVSSSIEEKFLLADGSYILYSGTISLSSSDPSIAQPTGNGIVYLKKTGTVQITAVQKAAPGYNAMGSQSYTLVVK
jgi:hypothetical protein